MSLVEYDSVLYAAVQTSAAGEPAVWSSVNGTTWVKWWPFSAGMGDEVYPIALRATPRGLYLLWYAFGAIAMSRMLPADGEPLPGVATTELGSCLWNDGSWNKWYIGADGLYYGDEF